MSPVTPSEIRRAIVTAFPEAATVRGTAWMVGGALRDALLGRASLDIDITVDGAEEVARDFAERHGARLIELGRERFVSWRVVLGRRSYDFTEVTRGSIEDDLGRRDFTINAMALPLEGAARLIDPFGGAADVERRLVRMVKAENLEDDPLRVLKAVRMVSMFGFALDPETARVSRDVAPRLRDVAVERVASELELIFSTGEPSLASEAFTLTGAGPALFGRDIPPLYAKITPGDAAVVFASIFRDEPDALRETAEALRLPGILVADAAAVLAFDRALDEAIAKEDLDVLLYQTGELDARRGASLRLALGDAESAARVKERISTRGEGLFSIEPLLGGLEIAELAGVAPGPILGRLKQELILAQVRGEVTTRDAAEAWLRGRASEL